jgi:RNA polymerase II elongation factor ELL
MSVSAPIPPAGLALHGIPSGDSDAQSTNEPAILFKLSDDLLRDVKKASVGQGGLQFLTGGTPVWLWLQVQFSVPMLLKFDL